MKKQIIIAIILVILVLFSVGIYVKVSSPSETKNPNSSSKVTKACAYVDYKLEPINGISAIIGKQNLETLQYENVNQFEYKLAQLNDYGIGVKAENIDKDYKVVYELCDMSDNSYIYRADFDDYIPLTASNDVGVGFISQNLTDLYTKSTGSNVITKPGKYSVNVFVETDSENWRWVATHEFEVVE